MVIRATCLAWLWLLAAGHAFAENSRHYTLTSQFIALAPNAGGQNAYSLRLATNNWELSGFSNLSVAVGGRALTGATFDWRFPICDDSCWWQFFVQAGAGVTNGGPVTELTWGSVLPLVPLWLPFGTPRYLPALRLDITTQVLAIRWRAVTWSYPLWAGLSVAF